MSYNFNVAARLIPVILFTLCFASCAELAHDDHESANVTYPAAYIVNGYSNTISVLRLSDNTIAETIALHGAAYPHHIAFDSVHKRIAVAITGVDLSGGHEHGSGKVDGLKVMILDAVTGQIQKEIACSGMPHNALFMRSGSELWFGEADSVRSTVRVVSTTDWSEKARIIVGAELSEVSASADGTRVFATNTAGGTVNVIDPNSYAVTDTITVGTTPVGAWPGLNGRMYVDNETSRSVTEIDVKSLQVLSTIDCGFMPAYALVTPTGELWISDATNGRVAWYTSAGASWTKAGDITTGAQAHALALNAAGTKVYCTNQGAHTVSVIDVATHEVVRTVPVGINPNGIVLRE
jgi:YVTN family beta-propeller protein